jgi:hypothetical protein
VSKDNRLAQQVSKTRRDRESLPAWARSTDERRASSARTSSQPRPPTKEKQGK